MSLPNSTPSASSSTFEHVLATAIALPPEDRATLAERLWESLDAADHKAIEKAWAEEAERRIDDYKQGRTKAIDGEEVFRSLRARLSS